MDRSGIAISNILGWPIFVWWWGFEVVAPASEALTCRLAATTDRATTCPILLLLLSACSACLKLDFLFLLFLPPFILFFLIILFISVPPAPPDLLPYFSPPPRPWKVDHRKTNLQIGLKQSPRYLWKRKYPQLLVRFLKINKQTIKPEEGPQTGKNRRILRSQLLLRHIMHQVSLIRHRRTEKDTS